MAIAQHWRNACGFYSGGKRAMCNYPKYGGCYGWGKVTSSGTMQHDDGNHGVVPFMCGKVKAATTTTTTTAPVDFATTAPKWSAWSSWSGCTATCGAATKVRARSCEGASCAGEATDTEPCSDDPQPCPVHGSWASWAGWSVCTATCGGGLQTRTRACASPAPAHGGDECAGTPSEDRQCNVGVSCGAPVLTAASEHCAQIYGAIPSGFQARPNIRWVNDGMTAGDPAGTSNHGVGQRGYWDQVHGVNTVADCARKCEANPNCKGFNWWGGPGNTSGNTAWGTLCHMGSRQITRPYSGGFCAFAADSSTATPKNWRYSDATGKWIL